MTDLDALFEMLVAEAVTAALSEVVPQGHMRGRTLGEAIEGDAGGDWLAWALRPGRDWRSERFEAALGLVAAECYPHLLAGERQGSETA